MIDKASDSPHAEEMIARITAPLGNLPASCRSAIFSNVQQAARVFERPPAPRLTSVRRELEEAAKSFKEGLSTHPELSDEARLYVRAAMAEPMSCTEDRVRFSPQEIEQGLVLIHKDIGSNRAHLGGRLPDDRLREFVTRLASIFADETDYPLHHTVDPATGDSISRYNRFTMEAVRAFYPSTPIPWSAVREAMRLAVLVHWRSEPPKS